MDPRGVDLPRGQDPGRGARRGNITFLRYETNSLYLGFVLVGGHAPGQDSDRAAGRAR